MLGRASWGESPLAIMLGFIAQHLFQDFDSSLDHLRAVGRELFFCHVGTLGRLAEVYQFSAQYRLMAGLELGGEAAHLLVRLPCGLPIISDRSLHI